MPSQSALDSLLAVLKTPELAADLSLRPELWAEIKRLADTHRFTGLLAHSTSAWLPASERPWRDQVLMTHHRRHQLFLKQLDIFAEAFREAHLPCLAIKGPVLAERFHPVPFLKSYHDLDVIIRRRDVAAVISLMQRLGFTLRAGYPWLLQQRFSHDLQFDGGSPRSLVEVHFALKAGPHLISAEEFINRSVTWRNYQVLSPADDCFYLIIHAAGHAFRRLRWLYDALAVAKTLDATALEAVRKMALERQLTGYFVAADIACREFFGEPLPLDLTGFPQPWLWSKLQSRHVRAMAGRDVSARAALVVDVSRMSGTPISAIRLCLQGANWRLRTLLYRLRGGTISPEIVATTISPPGDPS